jgi:large subunit ribosomal protein L13
MAKTIDRKTHTIDAKDQVLGRVSTSIANLLRGKGKPNYVPNLDMGDFVIVKNAEKIKLTGKKLDQKTYFHHTGWLGNQKVVPVKKIIARDYGDVLRRSVMGMLPKNKLRAEQIKRLKFEK